MKKLLEVLEYSDTDIRFNTELDFTKKPQRFMNLIPKIMMSMSSSLFGKNEINVFAIIRALAVADLALSRNREELLRELDVESEGLGQAFKDIIEIMSRQGKAFRIDPVSSLSSKTS